MTELSPEELGHWIRSAASTSLPISLDEIVSHAPDAAPTDPAAGQPDSRQPLVIESTPEQTVNKRNLALLAAAAVLLVAGFAYLAQPLDGPTDVLDEPAPTSTTTPADPVVVATEYWEALERLDDPDAAKIAAPFVGPTLSSFVERAETPNEQLAWLEAVGWNWELLGCEEDGLITAVCTVASGNAWSEALGWTPIETDYLVEVANGRAESFTWEENTHWGRWDQEVVGVFRDFVESEHPDDAARMWADGAPVDGQLIDLFALNTDRFVEFRNEMIQDSVEVATQYWDAILAEDVEALQALVTVEAIEEEAATPQGRFSTFPELFEWYDAVGWTWEIPTCDVDAVRAETVTVRCQIAARNDWSDALGLEPVAGAGTLEIAEGQRVASVSGLGFGAVWSSEVFTPFERWVHEHHPEDAVAMWDVDAPSAEDVAVVNELFRINTERFVQAQGES